jgi:hypothetical protein
MANCVSHSALAADASADPPLLVISETITPTKVSARLYPHKSYREP